MAGDYALTHKISLVILSRKGTMVQVVEKICPEIQMIERDKVIKSTENVDLVGKVEPLKPISCGHCEKPGQLITNCWKLGGKTPCEHCGRLNHKNEDCRIATNKLQKELNSQG